MSVTRRQFFKSAAATVALTAVPGPVVRPAWAGTNLTGVIYFTPTYKAIIQGARGFADYLNQHSADVVTMDLFDSAQLVSADEQLPALRAGNIDFMFHATSYVTRSLPILGITGLPGIVEELYRHPERLRIGSALFDLINDELAASNLYMLSAGGGVFEPEYLWANKETQIRSLADLRGRKARIAGYEATQALEPYGVAAVRVPSSETYLALQRGVVEIAVANVATIVGRSLYEQLGSCYQLPLTAYTVGGFMLRDRWDGLAPDVKEALQNAARWYDDTLVENANNNVYPNDYWPQVEAAGVDIIPPSEEDIAQFGESSKAVWESWKAEVGAEVGARAIGLALGKA